MSSFNIEELTITNFETPILDIKGEISTPSVLREYRTAVDVEFLPSNPNVSEWLKKLVQTKEQWNITNLTFSTIDVKPARRHKKRRIQKKWLKRYGYKIIKRKDYIMDGLEIVKSHNDELDALTYVARLNVSGKKCDAERGIYVPPLCRGTESSGQMHNEIIS